MKISNEQLEELIGMVSVSSNPLYAFRAADAFRELQQLREERRWRKFTTGAERVVGIYQFFSTKNGSEDIYIFSWTGNVWEDEMLDEFNDEDLTADGYTYFRPLPMDLPEKPVKKLPNLSDMVGICNAPDGTEYVRQRRDDLPEVE